MDSMRRPKVSVTTINTQGQTSVLYNLKQLVKRINKAKSTWNTPEIALHRKLKAEGHWVKQDRL